MTIASDSDTPPQQVFLSASLTWKQLLEALQNMSGLIQCFCVSGDGFLKAAFSS